MALVDDPSLSISFTPIKSTSLPSEAYVLSLASSISYYAASSSAPSNSIYLFDKESFRKMRDWTGHANAITCMKSAANTIGNVRESLMTCSKDGYVKFWDERSGSQPALQSKHHVTSSKGFWTELKKFSMRFTRRYSARSCEESASSSTLVRRVSGWTYCRCRD